MLWPRSLFGRLALLLLGVLSIAIAVTILLFRQDRAALIERQFGETKIVQLQALRTALGTVAPGDRAAVEHLAEAYKVRIVPAAERPVFGQPPQAPLFADLEERLKEALGEGTALRVQPRQRLLWIRLEATHGGYWIGFPLPPRPVGADGPSRALIWSLVIAAALVLAAFVFARYLSRPLRELDAAVGRVAHGETPAPLPESGPSEIVRVNQGFNRMLANLQQLEQDRALLLAGVSHDLRTPLARLRLGLEMGMHDEALKRGMTDDIEEMDRIIGQFLDFARNDAGTTAQPEDLDAVVSESVERYRRAGRDVAFTPGAPPKLALRRTAISRLVANLVDNAIAYGAPPIEIVTRAERDAVVLDVADRGPGIPNDEVERLKQPFTRASAARANAAGIPGAGLGLAIVERIARMHGGTFSLLPREGGGTIARLTLPLATAARDGSALRTPSAAKDDAATRLDPRGAH
jgi:two-component system osmolarity sensor histidine kinase EnvZ